MIDQLRPLAIFVKTIDHGSFRGAAKELGLSPSVVSHHISDLEEHLGVTLLYRSTRKLALTQEGVKMLSAARNMLEAVEGELNEITGNSEQPSGELRITAPSILSQFTFTNDIVDFLRKYPRIKVSLDYSDTSKELIDDGFDVAIRMWIAAKQSRTTKQLYSIERKLVASKAYVNQQIPIKKPEDLYDLEWLLLSPAHNKGINMTNQNNKQVKIKPDGRVFTNDASSLYHLVQSSLGFAALPEFIVKEDIGAGKIIHLLPEWQLDTVHVFAEWPVNATKNGLIKLFINELIQKHNPKKTLQH